MIVEAQVTIPGSRTAAWAAISDIAQAADIIRGIEKIEILEQPARGLVGLKWRETRLLFGKPESVDKWITAAVEGESYETRAEIPGFVFITSMRLSESAGAIKLASTHETRPQGLLAQLQSIPMRLFFKGVIRKAILRDLDDIKAAVARA
jgi:hypothetical protein